MTVPKIRPPLVPSSPRNTLVKQIESLYNVCCGVINMSFFRRKEWVYTPMDRPINTINIHLCDRFYELGNRGQDHDPAKNVITISPYYNDHDPVQDDIFYDFRRTCTAQILSRFPFVVEEVFEGDIPVTRGQWPFRKTQRAPVAALDEPYAKVF